MIPRQSKVKNEAELANFTVKLWRELQPQLGERAVILALEGPLGAGKTTLVKKLAREMGIRANIVSPTFVLHIPLQIPGSGILLEHIDAWRMESETELEQLGLEKMIENKSVIIIEWADRVLGILDKYRGRAREIRIKIDYTKKNNERRMEYEDIGDRNQL